MKNLKFKSIILVLMISGGYLTAQTTYSAPDVGQGDRNVFLGYDAGTDASVGNGSVFVGHKAGELATGTNRTILIGEKAGESVTGASYGVAIGFAAGQNMQGGYNVFIGQESGQNTTTGNSNLFLGRKTGKSNVSGTGNLFMGAYTGQNSIAGNFNICLGDNVAPNNNGAGNVFVGKSAGNTLSGSNNKNVFIGYEAGKDMGVADNTLIIENSSDTETPLIFGDFLNGRLGIKTGTIPDDYTFAVNGKALAEEVQVMARTSWPDYVFAKNYKLMPLPQLETTIEQLGHLPGVPSAEEVEKNGHALGEMDAILLEKVEELTLHLIEMNKQMEQLKERNQVLENRLIKIEKK